MQDTLIESDEPPARDGWIQPTHGQEKGISIESFKKSIATKRREEKLGLSDLQNSQSNIKNIQRNRNSHKEKDYGQSR